MDTQTGLAKIRTNLAFCPEFVPNKKFFALCFQAEPVEGNSMGRVIMVIFPTLLELQGISHNNNT